MKRIEPLNWLFMFLSLPLILLLTLPLIKMTFEPTFEMLIETISDKDVVAAIARSISLSLCAGILSFAMGTPLAYLLARKSIMGKKIIEGIIDLPIMIPHPVVGIAILSLAGRNHPIGRFLSEFGIQIMGTRTGIVCVLLFVGLPFYVNTVKAGFDSVPVRLENASRTLGAGAFSTFMRITFPLTWRHMILGIIMCTARAISEFGAVVIVAYHPMTAPVMIYERFTAYGLKYSQPIAVWLIIISFILFVVLRMLSRSINQS
ncbi:MULTISPECIES: ABC transporter permease [Desulfobacula]|uniref:WtpB: molybdate/tungstade transport system, pemease protein n=2 Tax=Desulfobacula TaxID=28222 RepID=K0NGT4_DESTT|nr:MULTISPECIES: ABC transporter permease [Desulfobacula]CCK80456.1 WtpB: molybdate/tungstade transport system, pemease protein [Desulfobacula toluolica Tol2]SDT97410.1 tungstate/molybdate transport system permease protein [Desulfobacula phenolica]